MDARVDGVPVTRRAGKPVEVNALWLRALDVVPGFESLRDTAASSFVRRFVRADGAGLFDVVDGPQGDDAAIRPNQLLGVSLPNGPLGPQAARAVVDTCRRSLLTPLGLRSLAPDDPRYRAVSPRFARRPRRRLPRGHGLAVADRAVPGRLAAGGPYPVDGRARRPRRPPGRLGPRLRVGDGRRGSPASRDRAARSRRGRSPSCCASERP